MLSRAILCTIVLLVLAPAGASAQFTTVVRPPAAAPERPAAAERAVERDTLPPPEIASMQAWVDSVAALTRDGEQVVAEGTPEVVVQEAEGAVAEPTTRFADGAPAPDTATSLPLIALLGLAAAGVGAGLLVRTRA